MEADFGRYKNGGEAAVRGWGRYGSGESLESAEQ